MTLMRSLLLGLVLSLGVLTLAGCPTPPQLDAAPKSVSFGATAVELSFFISNTGGGTLTWTLEEVVRADSDAPWIAQEIDWLAADQYAGSTESSPTFIALSADRNGQGVGVFTNTGLRISSNGGEMVIPVSMEKEATLTVSPSSLALVSTATSAQFSISNLGLEDISWSIDFLDDPDDIDSARPLPDDFFVNPNQGTTPALGSTLVSVSWASGRDDFYLRVNSSDGSLVVAFLYSSTPQGLTVSPSVLTLFVDNTEVGEGETAIEQVSSTLTITNTSSAAHSWQLTLISSLSSTLTAPISLNPDNNTTLVGEKQTVAVTATDVENIVAGSGVYSIRLQSGDDFIIIPITVEIMPLPEIAISEPPDPNTTRPEVVSMDVLDFGREEVQLTFWIANIGSQGSNLYFSISYDDQKVTNPVIAGLSPLMGDTTGGDSDFYIPNENIMIDGVPITVTVNRDNMEEDVEFRTVTVVAMDQDYETVYEPVEAATIQVRVERPPMKVEGAVNRSRPPFVMRFVFLLRDTLGQVIPTRSEEELSKLSFTISENEEELDLNETSIYLDGPESLKVNLVLMLDYTGSLYRAGTDNAANPLLPGEAIDQVSEAAKEFLDDLPESYRVALMYHNDRQQSSHLIHTFTTDRSALKNALDSFSLPDYAHGVSNIRDALMEGIERLVAEDPAETLPFDDADLRALLFISDGRDNSSLATLNEVIDSAHDQRVRLYPLTYGAGSETDSADMLVMAEDTGGHLYSAGEASNLTTLLASDTSLRLDESVITTENQCFFKVTNTSAASLNWSATLPSAQEAPWLDSVSPMNGSLDGGNSTTLTITVDPTIIGANNAVECTLAISSDDGEGTVQVRADVGADESVVEEFTLSLRDEPGIIWGELRNQVVLTYLTPKQDGGFTYAIRAEYLQPDETTITGFFEEDALFYTGDVRIGQLAMSTSGLYEDLDAAEPIDRYKAEVYLRTDYVPRGVTRFRTRFFVHVPEDIPEEAVSALEEELEMEIEIASEGLLVSDDPFDPTWRLLESEDHVYDVLTSQDNPLPYGSFGNLLKITLSGLADFVGAFEDLARQPEFFLEMRVDNNIYYSPSTSTLPSTTVFFVYPSCSTYPERALSISPVSDLAAPARSVLDLMVPGIDPESDLAVDRDEDELPDFNDPHPDDADLPGYLVIPNPYEIESTTETALLTVSNNRLDTFTWWLDEDSIPDWVSNISYGSDLSPTPKDTLAPGELEYISLTVDRGNLSPGFETETLILDTDFFDAEEIPLTIITVEE